MQHLYFVRHGQTELNASNHVQGGEIDSPLLPKSKVDAKKTGRLLKDKNITRIITSPQQRALDTSRLLASEFSTEVIIEEDSRLKEFGYGEWEGIFIPDIEKKYKDSFYHLRNQPDLYDPTSFGGETYIDLILRGTEAVRHHAENHPDSDLLFVGHGITTMATILTLAGFPLKDIRTQPALGNTSVSHMIKNDSEFELKTWNYLNHLMEND